MNANNTMNTIGPFFQIDIKWIWTRIALVLLFLPVAAFAQFTYYTNYPNTDTITISGYTGTGGPISIPASIGGKTVTRIEDAAFEGQDLITSVVIPDSVTSIGYSAFYLCTNLTSVTIGDGVEYIGAWAFSWCPNLTNATLGAGVITIADNAFYYCGLTSVAILNGVTSIGNEAFGYCFNLTNITIGTGVIFIGSKAFRDCHRLISISLAEGNTSYSSIDGVLLNKSKTDLICYPGGKSGAYVIPSGVTTIEELAFGYCTNLTSIVVPDSVDNIGYRAFEWCDRMRNATIGAGVTAIGSCAFYSCTSLTSVAIGNNVTNIGSSAFGHCISLTSIYLPATVTGIGDGTFLSCSRLTAVYFQGPPPNLGGVDVFYDCNTIIYYLPNSGNWGSTYGGRPTEMLSSAPIILSQPSSLFVDPGGTATFSVTAIGLPPLKYQWRFNTSLIPDATNTTLSITNAGANNIGTYRVIVSNSAGSAKDKAAEKKAFSVESKTATLAMLLQCSLGNIPNTVTEPEDIVQLPGKDSLILITHGFYFSSDWGPGFSEWGANMATALASTVCSPDWQVVMLDWKQESSGIAPSLAYNDGKIYGVKLGQKLAQQNWQNIHFIAHSAGGALIQAATETIKANKPGMVIHETFLDPYPRIDGEGRKWLGEKADFADCYYTENDITFGGIGDTEGQLNHAYNVEVSWLDPNALIQSHDILVYDQGTYAHHIFETVKSTHQWPHEYYGREEVGGCADDYGYPLSAERGMLASHSVYPRGDTTNLCGSFLIVRPVELPTVSYPIDPSALPSLIGGMGVTMEADYLRLTCDGRSLPREFETSPMDTVSSNGTTTWATVGLSVTGRVNYVTFDASYDETDAGISIFAVYWNTNLIGTVEESTVGFSTNHYAFELDDTYSEGLYSLGFELTPLTNAVSAITITNIICSYKGLNNPASIEIKHGNADVVPEIKINGVSNMYYFIDASTNMIEWVPTILLNNTNSTTTVWDPDATNFIKRYYRARLK